MVTHGSSAWRSSSGVGKRSSGLMAITRRTIAEAMITYPPLARFPEIEDAGWSAINAALRGELTAAAAVDQMQQAAEEALAP